MIQVDTVEKFTGESGTSNQMRIGQETFEEDVHFDRIWTGLLMDALKRGPDPCLSPIGTHCGDGWIPRLRHRK